MKNKWLDKNLQWSWKTKVNADHIIKILNIKKSDKVLDIGCGPGAYLNDIQKKTKAQCYGIDIRKDQFKFNKNKKVKLKYSDMENIKFPAKSFSKIFSLGTLEHTPRTDKVFSEVSRLLKKNGKVYFTVPNLFSMFHITKKIKQALGLWGMGYEAGFTINELTQILKKHKMKALDAFITPHPKTSNLFNLLDNSLNQFNNKKFGFFINFTAQKIENA